MRKLEDRKFVFIKIEDINPRWFDDDNVVTTNVNTVRKPVLIKTELNKLVSNKYNRVKGLLVSEKQELAMIKYYPPHAELDQLGVLTEAEAKEVFTAEEKTDIA